MTPEPPSESSRLFRFIRGMPIAGYAIRCLEAEAFGELALLGANVLMAAIVGILVLGYPFLITLALCATALAALVILSATLG
ncbi:MAG: hypothetical protein SFW09_20905 [Hyphomicrobiaceae bacterium]|nr:hypothetical protein [Hyphomicrobiaceae bacterium]